MQEKYNGSHLFSFSYHKNLCNFECIKFSIFIKFSKHTFKGLLYKAHLNFSGIISHNSFLLTKLGSLFLILSHAHFSITFNMEIYSIINLENCSKPLKCRNSQSSHCHFFWGFWEKVSWFWKEFLKKKPLYLISYRL